ncbi:MAG: PAS domain S-box protein [Bacteroidales bacterium]|jgi:PAS domain S-box-containing protein|nr:PAS domain S-box protein [Bacteroidales bacterium]
MIDYKEKYDKLLESYMKLEQKKGSGKLLEQVKDNDGVTGYFPSGKRKSQVFEEIFETISSYLALFSFDENGKIIIADLNSKAEEVECIRKNEVSGQHLDDTPLSTRIKLIELIRHVKITGDAHKLAASANGDDSEGYYMGFILTSGNVLITWEPGHLQKYREDLSRQRTVFRSFAEMLPQIVYELDTAGRIIYVNSIGLESFGYTPDDISRGIYITDVFPENSGAMIANLNELVKSDQVSSNEYYIRKKDGSSVPVLTHSFATFTKGKIAGYRGVITDISRQKNYEKQIITEKAFLEHLIHYTPLAIAITDKEGKITLINREFTNLFGYTSEEAIDRIIDDLIVPEELKGQAIKPEFITIEKEKSISQAVRKIKSGKRIDVAITVTNISINDEPVAYLGIYRDISNEKKSQLIQEILYNISTAALNRMEIKDIYPTIIKELRKIWDTNNFFIALYDKKSEKLSLPIFSDEKDSFYDLPARKTITRWVIGLKKPVLLKENDMKHLEESGDIDLVGTPCKVWMGVPLKADNEIIGVMCLQDYHDENRFSHDDVNVLEFIANQIAIAIQRRIMIDNVVAAGIKAEEAAQSKQQFMSTMSHEIRTPLNEVIGITNLLLQGKPREDQMEYIKTLRFSGNHLLTLVNDVLDYNKMESGKIVFEQTQFNLSDFLNDIMRTYSYRSKSKNLVFDIIKENKLPEEVIGDPIRLNQIMSNLLSNALKFTQNGSIYVIIKASEPVNGKVNIDFRVKDTGLGIPKDKHEVIFESFAQASADTTRHYGGTGLGLAICKKLVELQGGRIEIESEPGKGSTFRFNLPFEVTEKKEQVQVGEGSESYAGLEGKKILMAEDNKINFFVANKFLVGWGVIVSHAENGKIALDMLEREEFDLVIMDLHMPVMDGIEATRRIRNSDNPKIKSIPVVALTAAIMSENHDKIDDLSINDYVLKPFKPRDLFDKIIKNVR